MTGNHGGLSFYQNDKDHLLEIKELGIKFQYSCFKDKLPESCFNLGLWYQNYKDDKAKAMEIYKMNCETYKHPTSCLKYAIGLFDAIGVTENKLSAFEVFKKNCFENNEPRSCQASGIICASGSISHTPDFRTAVNYFEKGCDLDFPASCFHAGLMYIEDGEDNMKNFEKSAKYWTKSCNLGHHQACVNLAVMYKNGDYYEKDEEMFKKLLKKAEKNFDEFPPNIHEGRLG